MLSRAHSSRFRCIPAHCVFFAFPQMSCIEVHVSPALIRFNLPNITRPIRRRQSQPRPCAFIRSSIAFLHQFGLCPIPQLLPKLFVIREAASHVLSPRLGDRTGRKQRLLQSRTTADFWFLPKEISQQEQPPARNRNPSSRCP